MKRAKGGAMEMMKIKSKTDEMNGWKRRTQRMRTQHMNNTQQREPTVPLMKRQRKNGMERVKSPLSLEESHVTHFDKN